MFTHMYLGSNDIERSRKFYDATMSVLEKQILTPDDKERLMYHSGSGSLLIRAPVNGEPATHGNGTTIGFPAQSNEQVDAWHAAGLAAGGTDEGSPDRRPRHPRNAYGAYLRDPDGNKLCCYNVAT